MLKPTSNRIVLQPISKKEKTTATGIILTAERDSALDEGLVLAVGPGARQAGLLVPMPCNVGDTVLYEGGVVTTMSGERVVICFDDNIIGIVAEAQ